MQRKMRIPPRTAQTYVMMPISSRLSMAALLYSPRLNATQPVLRVGVKEKLYWSHTLCTNSESLCCHTYITDTSQNYVVGSRYMSISFATSLS